MNKALTLLIVLFQLNPLFAQKGGQRVIAEVNYGFENLIDPRPVMLDSSCFIYSESRHSNYNPNKFIYYGDFGWFRLDNDIGVYPDYLNLDPTRSYDSTYEEPVAYDSVYEYHRDTNGFTSLFCILTRSYNADGTTRLIERLIPPTSPRDTGYNKWYDWRQYTTHWSGRITGVCLQRRNGPVWDTFWNRTISYDVLGRVRLDSSFFNVPQILQPVRLIHYLYNGYKVQSKWIVYGSVDGRRDTVEHVTNEYDAFGNLATSLHDGKDVNGRPSSALESFSYEPDLPFYASRTWQGLTDPEDNNQIIFHFNKKSLADSMTITQNRYGAERATESGRYTYNTSGNPVLYERMWTDSTTGAGFIVFGFTRWYYQQYEADSISNQSSDITVTPNPTTGTLMLHYPAYSPGAPVGVAVYNMLGQRVYAQTFVLQGVNTPILFSESAAAGIYIIAVYDADNKALYKDTFLKQ